MISKGSRKVDRSGSGRDSGQYCNGTAESEGKSRSRREEQKCAEDTDRRISGKEVAGSGFLCRVHKTPPEEKGL